MDAVEELKVDIQMSLEAWQRGEATFDETVADLLALARSNSVDGLEEWLRSVAGLAETPGINYEAFADLVGKGAQGFLDRLPSPPDTGE